MRLLIYGAGVIGSIYAVKFANAGYDVTVLARGKRLLMLKENGLRYEEKKLVKTASVHVMEKLEDQDHYDFIFVPVQTEQIENALKQLRHNCSENIVTMVNTTENMQDWENSCGVGRIIPAFPGAGGGFHDGILEGNLTPSWLQPTTFGEFDGKRTKRSEELAELFRNSGIPYQIVPDMHHWLISHLGMVVPLADAYTMTDDSAHVDQDRKIMRVTAVQMKENFRQLAKLHMLCPMKFHLLRFLPVSLLTWILIRVYRSHFGEIFMYQHAMKAPDEMRQLHDSFYAFMKQQG